MTYEEELIKTHEDTIVLVEKLGITYEEALKLIEIQTLKFIQYYIG